MIKHWKIIILYINILKSHKISYIILLKSLLSWKISQVIEEHLLSENSKILLVDGARQVGKTYIIRYVGKKLFKNFIEINMIEDSISDRLYENVKSVEDFYLQVSMTDGNKMGQKE